MAYNQEQQTAMYDQPEIEQLTKPVDDVEAMSDRELAEFTARKLVAFEAMFGEMMEAVGSNPMARMLLGKFIK